MFLKPRILMNAAGSSPGSGQPAPTPAPQPAPAGGAPAPVPAPIPAPAPQSPAQGSPLSADAIKAISEGVIATLRQSGVLGAPKGRPAPAPAPAPSAESGGGASPGPGADVARMRELDRALNRSGWAGKLDEAAYRRVERAFADEAPESAESFIADYFRSFQQQQQQQQTPTNPQPQNQHPVSDRGAPPAPQINAEEPDLVRASAADRKALIDQKGLPWYRATLIKQLKGRPIARR